MTVAKSGWVYKSMLRSEKRDYLLKQLPENTQKVWSEYRKLGRRNYHITKIEKFIYYIFSIIIKVELFLKGRKVEVKIIYSDFLTSIENNNKKIEEFSQKSEVIQVLELFKKNNVDWNDYT